VAGFTRNQWQVYSGMGGRFVPESANGWGMGIGILIDMIKGLNQVSLCRTVKAGMLTGICIPY